MTENELSKIVVDLSFKIHKRLGPGLLQSVYETILQHELIKTGVRVERQKPLPVLWDGLLMDIGFRTDLIVDEKIIIEIKSLAEVMPVHKKQLLTYLKLTEIKLGLLINFNEAIIKSGITRIVNNL